MRRVSRLIALCLCVLALLCSCEGPDPQPTPSESAVPSAPPTVAFQSARFNLGYDPTASMHPITGNSQVNQELTGLVYQGLYELDNTFTPQPVLAVDASADEDALTWTFTLAGGVVFSDGTPFTSVHAAASLNLARTSALYATRLKGVSSVTAEDGAVVVTLSAPNWNLPALLDIPIVLEREPAEDEAAPPAPLGTGYYRYAQGGDRLYLQANPYHPSAVALPYGTIPLTPVTDTGERIAAFDTGEISAVTTDFSSPYALDYTIGYEATDYPTTSLLYVGFNAASGRVCRSAPVRQAFSHAFDRVSLVEVQLSGRGDPTALPVSPLCGEYSEAYAAMLEYDMDAAARLLAEAGYVLREEDGLLCDPDFQPPEEDGEDEDDRPPEEDGRVKVTLLVNSDNDVRQAVARQLADSLAQLGVTVTVSSLPWNEYTEALTRGRFDLYIGEVRLTGNFDPTVLLVGELDYSGLKSRALAQALTQWRATQGVWHTLAANTLWGQFVEDVPIAPLCFKRESLLVRWGMVSNVQPTRANPYYRMAEWTITG